MVAEEYDGAVHRELAGLRTGASSHGEIPSRSFEIAAVADKCMIEDLITNS